MSKDPSKTLELFFEITPDAIRADLVRAAEDISAVLADRQPIAAIAYDKRTPEQDARHLHILLLEAHYLSHREGVPEEVKIFYAGFAAGHVTQEAETVSSDKDTCLRLSAQMDEIRQREGLGDGESWIYRDEGPDDYRRLSEEFGDVLSRVSDTVFPVVLRRYQLFEAVDLFERDRIEFEIQREIGRRTVMPTGDTEVAKLMDDFAIREYGSEAFARIIRRADEIKRG